MKKIAIIPARGGSKRIPRKNIREFFGKPIIAYSIEAALQSKVFDTVMVSTDDKEIAEIAKKYGAEVPFFRSEELSNDYSSTDDVLLEVLNEYEKLGYKYDVMACIYPTAPFIKSEQLIKAMNIMLQHRPSEVMPMVRYSYPPQRSYRVFQDGKAEFISPQFITARSQDLEPMYHDIGQYYIFDVKKFCNEKGIIINDIMAIVVNESVSQDIDTEEDWKLAELKYSLFAGD